MSMIPCTQPCRFQEDGLCTLTQCTTMGQTDMAHLCVHFQPISRAPVSAVPEQSSAQAIVPDEEVP